MPKSKILIVDENGNLIDLLQRRLESSGYEVKAVTEEGEAVDLVRVEALDLGIMNLKRSTTGYC